MDRHGDFGWQAFARVADVFRIVGVPWSATRRTNVHHVWPALPDGLEQIVLLLQLFSLDMLPTTPGPEQLVANRFDETVSAAVGLRQLHLFPLRLVLGRRHGWRVPRVVVGVLLDELAGQVPCAVAEVVAVVPPPVHALHIMPRLSTQVQHRLERALHRQRHPSLPLASQRPETALFPSRQTKLTAAQTTRGVA